MKGSLTISLPQGDSKERIVIRIRDDSSSTTFFEGNMELGDFTKALTGHACMEIYFNVFNTARIGKRMEHKEIEVKLPVKASYDTRKSVAVKAAAAACPEGWVVSDNFGSQGSFFSRNGDEWARCTIKRWID